MKGARTRLLYIIPWLTLRRVVRQPSERPREQLLHYKPNAVQASVPIYEKEEKINPPFKDERRIKAKRMGDFRRWYKLF